MPNFPFSISHEDNLKPCYEKQWFSSTFSLEFPEYFLYQSKKKSFTFFLLELFSSRLLHKIVSHSKWTPVTLKNGYFYALSIDINKCFLKRKIAPEISSHQKTMIFINIFISIFCVFSILNSEKKVFLKLTIYIMVIWYDISISLKTKRMWTPDDIEKRTFLSFFCRCKQMKSN